MKGKINDIRSFFILVYAVGFRTKLIVYCNSEVIHFIYLLQFLALNEKLSIAL